MPHLNHTRNLLIEALGIDLVEWNRIFAMHIAPIVKTPAPLSKKIEKIMHLHNSGILNALEFAFVMYTLGAAEKVAAMEFL